MAVQAVSAEASAAQTAAIASWRQSQHSNDAGSDHPQPLLPPCPCCMHDEESLTWLHCVNSGVFSSLAAASPASHHSDSHHSPPACSLLSALLASPLLECIALLESYVSRLPLLPAADVLSWSVATHHLLHAIHAQQRDEAAAAVLSATVALRTALLAATTDQSTHPPSTSGSTHHSSQHHYHQQQQQAQLSQASHLLLSTAIRSIIAACSAATVTSIAITTTTTSTTTETRTAVVDQLLSHLTTTDAEGPSRCVGVPSALQVALFVASLDQLATARGTDSTTGNETAVDDGSSGVSAPLSRRLVDFFCSLLPPSCPHHSVPAAKTAISTATADSVENGVAAADPVWLWTLVSWRLATLHIRPLLRHMTQPQQAALTAAALRPCSQCCVSSMRNADMQPFALPAASQQLVDLAALTDSSAFADHLLRAATAHIDRILKPLLPASTAAAVTAAAADSNTKPSRKRARPSTAASIQPPPPSHRLADCIAPLLELSTQVRCLTQTATESWQMDSAVSERHTHTYIVLVRQAAQRELHSALL